MKGIIDRFEGKYAVVELENKTFINILKKDLPLKAKEGDCLIIDESSISIDLNEKSNREENIKKLMDELFED